MPSRGLSQDSEILVAREDSMEKLKPCPRILLVEDLPDQAYFTHRILRDQGCDLITVENGTQAILALNCQDFDLVILDLMLPVESGLDVLMHLKNREKPT